MLHQLEPQFGRDEGARSSPRSDDLSLPSSAEHPITKTVLLNSSGCNYLIRTTGTLGSSGCRIKLHAE
jgi:hypothetical protein